MAQGLLDAVELAEQGVAKLVEQRAPDVFVATAKTQAFDARDGQLAVQAQRAFDGDFPVTKRGVRETFGFRRFLEVEEGAGDAADVLGRQFAVFLAQVLAQGLEPLGGVDQLHLAFAVRGLAVGQHPDVGGNAGVVEQVERQGDDGFQPVVFDDPAAYIAFALARVAGKQRTAVVDLGNAAAQRRLVVHLGGHVDQE